MQNLTSIDSDLSNHDSIWPIMSNNNNDAIRKSIRASTSHSSLLSPITSAPPSFSLLPNAIPSLSRSQFSIGSRQKSFRRFSHCKDPNFSLESFLQKKQQEKEYRADLDRQVELKHRRKLQNAIRDRIKETELDKKIALQQEHLREEFEQEHPDLRAEKIKQQKEHQNTERHVKSHHSSSDLVPKVSMTPLNITATEMPKIIADSKVENIKFKNQLVSVETQTDNSLLLELITELMATKTIDEIQYKSTKRQTKSSDSHLQSRRTKGSITNKQSIFTNKPSLRK